MRYLRNRQAVARRRRREQGFTLVELLVTMAITTVILGATMAAMTDAIKATESASQISDMNNGLRTAMDLMVRDLLQVGQGLPGGRAILVPNGGAAVAMQLPGPDGFELSVRWPVVLSAAGDGSRHHLRGHHRRGSGSKPRSGPRGRRGPGHDDATDMITTLAVDSSFESVTLRAFAADGRSITVPLPGWRPPWPAWPSTRRTRAVTTSLMTRTSAATTFVPAI